MKTDNFESQEYSFGMLKSILENLRSPDKLDGHPWINSLFVQQYVRENPLLSEKSGGYQLAMAVTDAFRSMMPGLAPKRGKRLDTRWGEFGILAAQYFAPFVFGQPYPNSLREAWGKIDESILVFRYEGKRTESLSSEEIERYKLVGDELEVSPISTISDWQRKGVERLAGLVFDRERHLSHTYSQPSVILDLTQEPMIPVPEKSTKTLESGSKKKKNPVLIWLRWAVLLFALASFAVVTYKGYQVYLLARVVQSDVTNMQNLMSSHMSADVISTAGPMLSKFQNDVWELKGSVSPLLGVASPWLRWIPVYGEDIAASADLLDFAYQLSSSLNTTYQVAAPFYAEFQSNSSDLDVEKITEWIVQSQPQFLQARQELDSALAVRGRIDENKLSPLLQPLLKKIDPYVEMLDEGLSFAIALPSLLGAGSDGPKTYLILVQNEDELRPTGGFITAVTTVLVEDGRISGMKFQDSGAIDRWDSPYPAAPWQIAKYMNIPVMVFRDSNWFVDFPTSAKYAESLYSYANSHSVDGVIAIDQHVLVELLRVLGPVDVEGVPYPIDANNVIAYMRASKTPTSEDRATPGWFNKIFMEKLSSALISKIFDGDVPWKEFSSAMTGLLDGHHVMLLMDDPALSPLLSQHGWVGNVVAGDGDFLMVIDSNIGMNKTNAVVETSLSYEIDLSNLAVPISDLFVEHKNNALPDVPCGLRNRVTLAGEKDYPINRCYWDYMRVYVVDGARLLQANPQEIPAEWTMLNQTVSPRVDTLDENIAGVSGYGVLKVAPGGEVVTTSMRFALPTSILKIQPGTRNVVYHLRVQKQPGTIAVPFSLQIRLPDNVIIQSFPSGANTEGQILSYETTLKTDLEFEVVFQVP